MLVVFFLHLLFFTSNKPVLAMDRQMGQITPNTPKKKITSISQEDITNYTVKLCFSYCKQSKPKVPVNISSIDPRSLGELTSNIVDNESQLLSIAEDIKIGNSLLLQNKRSEGLFILESAIQRAQTDLSLLAHSGKMQLIKTCNRVIDAQLQRFIMAPSATKMNSSAMEKFISRINNILSDEKSSPLKQTAQLAARFCPPIMQYVTIKTSVVLYVKWKEAYNQKNICLAKTCLTRSLQLIQPLLEPEPESELKPKSESNQNKLAQSLYALLSDQVPIANGIEKNTIGFLHSQLIKYYQLENTKYSITNTTQKGVYVHNKQLKLIKNELNKEYKKYLSQLETLSLEGNTEAQELLIKLYREGKFVEKSHTKVLEHCRNFVLSMASWSKPSPCMLVTSTLRFTDKQSYPEAQILETYLNLFTAKLSNNKNLINTIFQSFDKKSNPIQYSCMELMFERTQSIKTTYQKMTCLTSVAPSFIVFCKAKDPITIPLLQYYSKQHSNQDSARIRIYNYLLGLYYYSNAHDDKDYGIANSYFNQCSFRKDSPLIEAFQLITHPPITQKTTDEIFQTTIQNFYNFYTLLSNQKNSSNNAYRTSLIRAKELLACHAKDSCDAIITQCIQRNDYKSGQIFLDYLQLISPNASCYFSALGRLFVHVTEQHDKESSEFKEKLISVLKEQLLYSNTIRTKSMDLINMYGEKALNFFIEHVISNTDNFTKETYVNRGIILYHGKKFFRAYADFKKSIALNVDDQEKIIAYCYLSKIRFRLRFNRHIDTTNLTFLQNAHRIFRESNKKNPAQQTPFCLTDPELCGFLSRKAQTILQSRETSAGALQWCSFISKFFHTLPGLANNFEEKIQQCALHATQNGLTNGLLTHRYLDKKTTTLNEIIKHLLLLHETPEEDRVLDIPSIIRQLDTQYPGKDSHGLYCLTSFYAKDKYPNINSLQAYFNLLVGQLCFNGTTTEKTLRLIQGKVNSLLHTCLKIIFSPGKDLAKLCKNILDVIPGDKSLIQFCQDEDNITIPYLKKLLTNGNTLDLKAIHAFNHLLGMYYYYKQNYPEANRHFKQCLTLTSADLLAHSLAYATQQPLSQSSASPTLNEHLSQIPSILPLLLTTKDNQNNQNKRKNQCAINIFAKAIKESHEILLSYCMKIKDYKNAFTIIDCLHFLDPQYNHAEKMFLLISNICHEPEIEKENLLKLVFSSMSHKAILQAAKDKLHDPHCCAYLVNVLSINKIPQSTKRLFKYMTCALSHADLPHNIRTTLQCPYSKLTYQLGVEQQSIDLLTKAIEYGSIDALYAKAELLSEKDLKEEKSLACTLLEKYIKANSFDRYRKTAAINLLINLYLSMKRTYSTTINQKKTYLYLSQADSMHNYENTVLLALLSLSGIKKKDGSWYVLPNPIRAQNLLNFQIKYGSKEQQASAYFNRGLTFYHNNQLLQAYSDFGKCVAMNQPTEATISAYLHMAIILILMQSGTSIDAKAITYLKKADELLVKSSPNNSLIQYLSQKIIDSIIGKMSSIITLKNPNTVLVELCSLIGILFNNIQTSARYENPLNYLQQLGLDYLLYAARNNHIDAMQYARLFPSDKISLYEKIYFLEYFVLKCTQANNADCEHDLTEIIAHLPQLYPKTRYEWYRLLEFDCNKQSIEIFKKHIEQFYNTTFNNSEENWTPEQFAIIKRIKDNEFLDQQINLSEGKTLLEIQTVIFITAAAEFFSTAQNLAASIDLFEIILIRLKDMNLTDSPLFTFTSNKLGVFCEKLATHYYSSKNQDDWVKAFSCDFTAASWGYLPTIIQLIIHCWLEPIYISEERYTAAFIDFISKRKAQITPEIKQWLNILIESNPNDINYISLAIKSYTQMGITNRRPYKEVFDFIQSMLKKIDTTQLIQKQQKIDARSDHAEYLKTTEGLATDSNRETLKSLAEKENPHPLAALLSAIIYSEPFLNQILEGIPSNIWFSQFEKYINAAFSSGIISTNDSSTYKYFISETMLAQFLYMLYSCLNNLEKTNAKTIVLKIKFLLNRHKIDITSLENIYLQVFKQDLTKNNVWQTKPTLKKSIPKQHNTPTCKIKTRIMYK